MLTRAGLLAGDALGAFAASEIVFVKQAGVGIAVAVRKGEATPAWRKRLRGADLT